MSVGRAPLGGCMRAIISFFSSAPDLFFCSLLGGSGGSGLSCSKDGASLLVAEDLRLRDDDFSGTTGGLDCTRGEAGGAFVLSRRCLKLPAVDVGDSDNASSTAELSVSAAGEHERFQRVSCVHGQRRTCGIRVGRNQSLWASRRRGITSLSHGWRRRIVTDAGCG